MALPAAILVAFLCGSVPFGLLIGRARGIDIRRHGSGNIGATNVGRVLGKRLGLACFALDLCKGLAPVLAFGLWRGFAGRFDLPPADSWQWLAVMSAPVLGHVFCPWVGFRGGKGVATGLGVLLGVFPVLTIAGVGALCVWLLSLRLWRMVSASSIAAAASLPAWIALAFAGASRRGAAGAAWVDLAWPYLLLGGLLALLVIVKHRANVSRILKGTEPRVTWLGGKAQHGRA